MRHLLITVILFTLTVLVGITTALSLTESLRASPQAETFCPPWQQPYFDYGFAFLKGQLGAMMGEPLECEHYDAASNAFQRTTTGQAFYQKETNTPIFSSGNRHWAWTSSGLKQWTDNSGAMPTAGLTLTPAVTTSVRVMSYNILFGAGTDPDWERAAAQLSPYAYPGNRLDKILSVIQAAQPDIVGIQEAANWDNGSPPLAQQVAKRLGMNYFLAQTNSDLNVVLFTRFEIVAAENLSPQVGNVGSLRADLALPGEQILHVFVVHLDPFSAATRTQELVVLTQKIVPYLSGPTLLVGDMNYYCQDKTDQCQEYNVLSRAGWRLVLAGQYKIDQIWVSPGLTRPVEPIAFPEATFEISDHLPVGAVINIAPMP